MPREQRRPAQCHPDRRHAAKGLCFACYQKQYPKAKRAECHPDRILHARGMCRACYDRHLREANPAYADRQQRKYEVWLAGNYEHVAEYQNNYQQRDDVRLRSRKRAREAVLASFGLTWEDESRMLEQQGGVCGICGGQPARESFDIDHDHQTGKVRGLLCGKCNKGLGLLGDNEHMVKQALRYLRKASKA